MSSIFSFITTFVVALLIFILFMGAVAIIAALPFFLLYLFLVYWISKRKD